MSACLYLPDGRMAFFFERATVDCEHAARRIAVRECEPWRPVSGEHRSYPGPSWSWPTHGR